MENKSVYIPEEYCYNLTDEEPIFECEEDAKKYMDLRYMYDVDVSYSPVDSFRFDINEEKSKPTKFNTIPKGHQPPILEEEFELDYHNIAYLKSFKFVINEEGFKTYVDPGCHITSIPNLDRLIQGGYQLNYNISDNNEFRLIRTIKLDDKEDDHAWHDYMMLKYSETPAFKSNTVDIVIFRVFDKDAFEETHKGMSKVQVADACKKITDTFEGWYKDKISFHSGECIGKVHRLRRDINDILND